MSNKMLSVAVILVIAIIAAFANTDDKWQDSSASNAAAGSGSVESRSEPASVVEEKKEPKTNWEYGRY
ncbi:MAG: hypothetical protein L0Z73_09515 [Gammaproteobacteria bacterium]|nr:hypothetical protein [Gammaproteobacteria bacterium]